MATILGKRKSRDREARYKSGGANKRCGATEDQLDVFRRAFEAKFKPLDGPRKVSENIVETGDTESDASQSSDWEGFNSHDEEANRREDVQVVEHDNDSRDLEAFSKAQMRAFMNSKPPSSEATKSRQSRQPTAIESDDDDDQLDLKNDLALQRLISESHILDQASKSDAISGHRQKLTDKRLQTLGSKKTILEQQKMPLSHRMGIVAKAREREAKRRREARENGIVLEKPASKSQKPVGKTKRARGIGAPAVGKFKGGTLRLSKRDVAEIKGQKLRPSRVRGKLVGF